MPSPILARADALMHRRRPADGEPADVPVLTDSIDTHDDLPVLMDIANGDALEREVNAHLETLEAALEHSRPASPHKTEPPAPPPAPDVASLDPALREQLVCLLAHRIEQRLASEIPRLIEAVIDDFLSEQAASPPSRLHD